MIEPSHQTTFSFLSVATTINGEKPKTVSYKEKNMKNNYWFKLLTIGRKSNNEKQSTRISSCMEPKLQQIMTESKIKKKKEKQSILLCRIWVFNLKLISLIGFLTKK